MPQWFRRLGVTAPVTKKRDHLIKLINGRSQWLTR